MVDKDSDLKERILAEMTSNYSNILDRVSAMRLPEKEKLLVY